MMNQPQLQSVLYYIYVFSLFSTVAHAMNMISRLWARLLYLMNVSGSGSNLANLVFKGVDHSRTNYMTHKKGRVD
jgi:hypothetical protein